MSSGIFGVGITGMNAAYIGLLTTEHNITNVNTPGFSRQRIGQTSNIALQTGAGFVGQGSRIVTVARNYNEFIQTQINSSQTQASELGTYLTQIKQIDNLLADPSAGLSPALQNFFTGVQEMAANPASIAARQSFVSSAQALATRFQTLESRFAEMYDATNRQIDNTVQLINSYAAQIAEINQRIVVAEAATSQPPNDLYDERDHLIAELNKEVRVSTVQESDGSMSVFIGSGQQLVVGQRAGEIDARPSFADGERFVVGLKIGSSYQELPESLITGGNLAGLLRFRSESLDKAADNLGQVAVSVTNIFNAQQSLGQDLLGQVAGDAGFADKIFLIESPNVPKIISNQLNTGNASIAATPATEYGQTSGFLTPQVTNGDLATEVRAASYQVVFSGGGNYTIRRLTDGVQVHAGNGDGTVTFDGVSINITDAANANAGDSFVVQPVREAARAITVNPLIASDPRLVAAAVPVRSGIGINAGNHQPNSGNGKISSVSVEPGYMRPVWPINLTYNAATQEFSGFPSGADPRPYDPAGTKYDFDGISFTISGVPDDNDRFVIEANADALSDAGNAVLMGKLQSKNTMLADASGGKASFQGVYAQLVSDVGNKTREIQVTAQAQENLLKQAQDARESVSGVNMDEEAANLLRYQYAYQASARMLEVGTRLFDTVLSIGR